MRLSDYAPPTFLVDAIALDFDLGASLTRVRSRLTVRRSGHAPEDARLRLDGVNLILVGLALDGVPLGPGDYDLDAEGLTVSGVGDAFQLDIETEIHPDQNRTGHGLFDVYGKLITQCEAEGFRRITFFPDRPDVLARYRVTLAADPALYPVLLSNGDRVAEGVHPDGRRWVTWQDPYPKPCYIFAIAAGDFGVLADSFTTRSGREVSLGVYADHDLVPQCRFAMEVIKRALAWDEDAYGLEYDLDVYNVVAVTGWAGAMENKGLNLFGASGVVADPEITTDDDYVIIERIIGHEAFHNWTGNRVTCRDWFQLCLKEGLTRFRDQHFIEDRLGAGAWRIETVKQLRRNQFAEDDGPAAHPIRPDSYAEISNFYTNTVYDKGAEVVRMLRALLGPAVFRKGFDLYIARHDGQAVTTEAFVAAMEDAAGRDLTQFRLWYSQAGRPRIEARGAYDAAARRYTLTLRQACAPSPGQPIKAPFHIPIDTGLLSPSGESQTFRPPGAAAPVLTTTLELTAREQAFVFEDVARPPIPSLLRGFSAPVTLDTGLSDIDLATLMRADPDPFARWDAGQTLGIRVIRALAEDHAAGRPMAPPEALLGAIGATLEDEGCDLLLRAQLLTVPDEPVLSEGLARIDLDGLMAARGFIRRQIASRFEGRLMELYLSGADNTPYQPDIVGISRRKFRNTVLDLLSALGTADVAQLCLAQVRTGANLTDVFEALCSLTHLDRPERAEAIAWFHDRWRAHPTVIDKWFNAVALSRAPGAVDDIIALERHPAFDINNASRTLLYYGGFFRQNRVAFHDPSGKGYAFLADRLLTMDAMGRGGSHYVMPQINQWRRYDARRQGLMRAALERVAATPGISKGLTESVTKALA